MLVGYLVRLSLLRSRTFDPDEFEHLHAAWELQRGLLPFRDFSEHHMPGMYYLLAPLLGGFDVTNRVTDAIHFLFVARTAMWGVTGCIVVLTVLLGARMGGPIVGWLSGALLSLSVVFVARTLEIRPDVPALAFWVASQLALMHALAPTRPAGRRLVLFGIGGLCLGCALLFTQKALLAGPGFAAFALLYLVSRVPSSSVVSKVLELAALLVGSVLPLVLLVAYFWMNHAVGDLVRGVLTDNLGWPREVTASTTLQWMLLRDPLLCGIAVAGMLYAVVIVTRRAPDWMAQAVVLLPTASLLAGLAIMPAPYPQYLMLTFPAAAAWGATYLWTTAQEFGAATPRGSGSERWALLASGAAVAVIGLAVAQPFYRYRFVYPLVGSGAVALAIACARRRKPALSAMVFVIATSVYTAQQLLWMHGLSNTDALEQIRFIHTTTKPTDRVMDGFSGFGWFRPQASVHWFVPPGARLRMTPDEVATFASLLNDCQQQPKIVILDDYLRDVSPAVASSVSRHYNRTSFPLLWLKNDDRECQDVQALRPR